MAGPRLVAPAVAAEKEAGARDGSGGATRRKLEEEVAALRKEKAALREAFDLLSGEHVVRTLEIGQLKKSLKGYDELKAELREVKKELEMSRKRAREDEDEGEGEGEAGPSGTASKKKSKKSVERSARWEELQDGVWSKIMKELPQRDAFAFASTCKQFRRVQVASGVELVTREKEVVPEYANIDVSTVSQGWCLWHSRTLRESEEEEAGVIMQAAAFHGYLDVLKLWRGRSQFEKLWTYCMCEWAAMGGQLDVLKFLRSQDLPCPWSEGVCFAAAMRGHLEVLRWLRSEGCAWNKPWCKSIANSRGHTHIVSWIDEQTD